MTVDAASVEVAADEKVIRRPFWLWTAEVAVSVASAMQVKKVPAEVVAGAPSVPAEK